MHDPFKGLRVGVRTGAGADTATDGGGWTLVTALVNQLRRHTSEHTFVMMDDLKLEPDAVSSPTLAPEPEVRTSPFRRLLPWGRAKPANPLATPDVSSPIEAHVDPPVEDTGYWNQIAQRYKLDIVWFLIPVALPIDTPYIATVWDLEHRKQPFFPEVSIEGWTWDHREAIYRASLPRASFVLTGTEAGRREIERFYGVSTDRIRVQPFPVPQLPEDVDSSPEAHVVEACSDGGDLLFYPAQYWPHKNHINLILALRLQRDKGHNVRLLLTGSDKGNKAHVFATVQALELSGCVVDLGFVSRASLTYLYRRSTALVYPSFFGPDNLPPLEAFDAGCPVAASDVDGAREQLGDAALYFDGKRPEDISTCIDRICKDLPLRDGLIARGASLAEIRTADRYIAGVEAILDEFAAIRRCWSGA